MCTSTVVAANGSSVIKFKIPYKKEILLVAS